MELLRAEIVDLQSRLAAADREKAQAGELGLHLLQEKELLERQLEQLQAEYDTARIELEETKKVTGLPNWQTLRKVFKALGLFRTQQRVVTASEMDNEERLLADSAKLEAEFTERISILENELKTLQPVSSHFRSQQCKSAFDLLEQQR